MQRGKNHAFGRLGIASPSHGSAPAQGRARQSNKSVFKGIFFVGGGGLECRSCEISSDSLCIEDDD